MQPPHNTPVRLPAHREFAFLLYARGGGNGHDEDPQPQYPGGHRLASVRGPVVTEAEFENFAQNPLVTFTKVVQSRTAKGQTDTADRVEAGKQRSVFLDMESSSSGTADDVNDIWKGRHGLQV